MHILIAIPSPSQVDPDFALGNLQDIISHTRKKFPDWKVSTAYKTGVRTDANRNHILKEAIADGTVDYILWLDADMLYPAQIIERYFDVLHTLKQPIDIIGCLYFKRSYPYDPIAYELNETENKNVKPYRSILPSAIQEDTVYEVAGLGYGGMMVRMGVYDALGDKKWTRYGDNFHLPFDSEEHLTHDLQFCRDAKSVGLSIKLHGGVRPGHLSVHPVTIEDWQRATEGEFVFKNSPPKVLVVMPTTDVEQAKVAAEIMRLRAGAECDIAIVEDDRRVGYVSIVNTLVNTQPHDIIVYTAQDALVGHLWLKHALIKMLITDAGLIGFHDGKWGGRLASFGMVQRSWFKKLYKGNLFFPEYHSHYADTELTQIAKEQGRYAYAEKAVMLEVDWQKAIGKGKGVVKADKTLYKRRKKAGFGGLVTSPDILNEFS